MIELTDMIKMHQKVAENVISVLKNFTLRKEK